MLNFHDAVDNTENAPIFDPATTKHTHAMNTANIIQPAFETFTVKYETAPCKRCGGSGNYSYNMMYGTVCFGCSGRKVFTTKAGERAKALVRAALGSNGKHAAQAAALMLYGCGVASIVSK
jgi:hypothetical protein